MKKAIIVAIMSVLFCSSVNTQNDNKGGFFVFEPDSRLFTSYAFMNAAGYSHDWNKTMHPIRVEIRNYLDSMLTDSYKTKIRQYFDKLGGGDFYGYGVYAINSKFPPEFGLICDTC